MASLDFWGLERDINETSQRLPRLLGRGEGNIHTVPILCTSTYTFNTYTIKEYKVYIHFAQGNISIGVGAHVGKLFERSKWDVAWCNQTYINPRKRMLPFSILSNGNAHLKTRKYRAPKKWGDPLNILKKHVSWLTWNGWKRNFRTKNAVLAIQVLTMFGEGKVMRRMRLAPSNVKPMKLQFLERKRDLRREVLGTSSEVKRRRVRKK